MNHPVNFSTAKRKVVGATGFESQLHTTRLFATIHNKAVVIDDYSLLHFSTHAHYDGGYEVFLSAIVSRFSLPTLVFRFSFIPSTLMSEAKKGLPSLEDQEHRCSIIQLENVKLLLGTWIYCIGDADGEIAIGI